MKKIINLSFLICVFSVITSCENNFDELNTSKTGITNLDPALVLNDAVIFSSFPAGSMNYEAGIVQQVISSNTGLLVGANFNQVNINNTPAVWINYYQNVVKYTADVIVRNSTNTTRSNLTNMARIVRANAFIVLTDTYGSVPYTNAGKGYSDQVFFPDYQKQDVIYTDIIKELTEATDALDAAGKVETTDVLYAGNIAKWKKFGYSLLLRAGMRLSAANATAAQAAVTHAYAGGVILVNADNAVVKHDANFVSPVGNLLNSTEAANYYLAAPFVDALKNNNDPRLSAIAVRYVGATSGPGQVAGVATTAIANQYGMPMGSTDGTADVSAGTLPGGGARYAYSQVDRTRLVKRTSPVFLVTAGQSNLLLAEARLKGWVTDGTAADFYSAGIKAHMDQMALYDVNSTVAGADRDTYVGDMLDTFDGNELSQIGYEYWVASFLNGPEAWSNFRRTGFPVLAVNPFPGRTVDFITRLTYPPSELLVNNAKVQAAITDQGPDNLDTKVWWDK
ncbi:SusD/RagB family nutrient-binding outer membrane lipoprotein [Chryseolinea lacunae]|uniref:SusD/RagB family nutrient-binding outer membrane lipoprotein n=1 Tax=Chryseolinea lacunae TaxID=2801331 RepID=A0ABS1KWZ8_9BACT|nr:SusD/RagB family nutrient-binding outer membrane lipoprotein [Chryseolinea lacunae]MBL0743980.1 SusD/RagB family nutrient-binding outer membrane lipoprotein [Chryseolinea lacunae]